MTPLSILLIVKILVTAIMVALPFLLLQKAKLESATAIKAQSPALFRLYGVAILALLVGYAGGIWQVSQGVFPWGVLAMGLFSNAGAALTMLLTGTAARNRFLALFFTLITLGLIAAMLMPTGAMQSLA